MACDNLVPYVKTPWVNGTVPAINALHLNNIENGIGDVTTCATEMKEIIGELEPRVVPPGAILMWFGAAVPAGWALCNGQNGTPNLIDRFVRGGSANGSTGGSDYAAVINHNHDFNGIKMPEHSHGMDIKLGGLGELALVWTGSNGVDADHETEVASAGTPSGNISWEGESGEDKNMPAYYTLMYIMKL